MKVPQLARMMPALLVVALLWSCAGPTPKPIDPADLTDLDGTKSDPAVAKFSQAYKTARTAYEKRDIILQAIDEGVIYPGRYLSALNAIVGEPDPTYRPIGKDTVDMDHFCITSAGMPTPPPYPEQIVAAYGCLEWSMVTEYDEELRIRTYVLSNILKTSSRPNRAVTNPTPPAVLKEQYAKASSEFERRAVCLRAIDEGVLRTYQPVAKVDELFGTNAAAHLPTRKEEPASGIVNFGTADPNAALDSTGAGKAKSWYLKFTYLSDGTIGDYYLSNGPQLKFPN